MGHSANNRSGLLLWPNECAYSALARSAFNTNGHDKVDAIKDATHTPSAVQHGLRDGGNDVQENRGIRYEGGSGGWLIKGAAAAFLVISILAFVVGYIKG